MQNFQHLTGMALAAIVTLSGASGAGAEVLAVAFPPHAPATAASPAAQVPDAAVTEMRGLRLVVDFAAILHVEGGMSVVAVGNPAIADASLVNQRTVIVTGHLAGTTNVITLDEAGRVLADVRVHVTSQKLGMVRVQRGTQVEVRSCINGLCEIGPDMPVPEASPPVAAAGS